MLQPGVQLERFDEAAFLRQVLEELPLEGSIPPPFASQSFQCVQKRAAIRRPNLILHGDQHWPLSRVEIARQSRGWPVHGWREVEGGGGLELPSPEHRDCN
jgi:hypothetical protein